MVGLKKHRPVHTALPARPFTVALVGIGGYGDVYLRPLLASDHGHQSVRLVSAVDPSPSNSLRFAELSSHRLPVYGSVEELYARCETAPDLVVLASPIAVHAEQTICALKHGSHVLCEKPLSATVEQARQMIAARDQARRVVAIGYQWSFCDAIQNLKRDIAAGRFGKARRLRTLVSWPRDQRYYTRNNWVGRRLDPTTGAAVFDSPVNNACAHFLHNMLYVLGDQIDRSAVPNGVTAELYRANAIENYDTAAIRCTTRDGAELLFYVSHAVENVDGPILAYEFEQATVRCEGDAGEMMAHLDDGSVINYGVPASSVDLSKLWRTIRAIQNNTPVECGIEASMAQTQVMCASQRSVEAVVDFPSHLVRAEGVNGSRRLYVHGLNHTLRRCMHEGKLPSELGLDWARPGKQIFTYDC